MLRKTLRKSFEPPLAVSLAKICQIVSTASQRMQSYLNCKLLQKLVAFVLRVVLGTKETCKLLSNLVVQLNRAL